MHVDERTLSAVQLLRDEVAYGAGLSLRVRGLLTNNGSAFRSNKFASACKAFGMRHRFTRLYRPQTNGKAERFIQSTLCDWPYGFNYQHFTGQTKALDL